MLVYLLASFVFIFPYLTKGVVRDDSRMRLITCFLVLSLISGLAYYMGGDTRGLATGIGYVDYFKSIHKLSELTSLDFSNETYQPGFVYIMSFFKTLSPNYLYYQLFHAFLINFIVVLLIKKNTQHVGLCLFFYGMLYYLDLNFEIQRESFAIVLGLLVYLLLERHNNLLAKVTAAGIAVLGFFLLHKSAFILILYPLLKDVRLNKLSIVISFTITVLVQVIWMRFPDLGMLIDVVAGDTYQGYVNQELLESYGGVGPVYMIWLTFWRVVIPYVFIFLSYKNCNPRYLIFVVIGIMFENLMYFSFAFHRFYGYFSPFYWLALTDGVVYIGKKYKLMDFSLYRIVLVLFLIVFIIYTYHSDYFLEDPTPTSNVKYIYNWYIPYQSVLEPGNSYVD